MAKLHKNNAKIHLEAPITTAIGHLDQQRKNVQSTKLMEVWEATPTINNGTQTHSVLEAMAEFNETIGAIHTYLTSQPPTYIRGNKYMFVLYNCILNVMLVLQQQI